MTSFFDQVYRYPLMRQFFTDFESQGILKNDLKQIIYDVFRRKISLLNNKLFVF